MNVAQLASLFLAYKYPFIFLVTIVEGPIIMVMSGLLVSLRLAGFWPIYITLMAGDLAGDVLWYTLGYHFARPVTERYWKFLGLTPELIEKIKSLFQNHEKKILFISKITMGFGFPLAALVVAGMTKMPFKKYIGSLFLGQVIFTGVLVSVGYFFGNIYLKINKDFQIISLIAFAAFVVLAIAGLRSYLRKQNI